MPVDSLSSHRSRNRSAALPNPPLLVIAAKTPRAGHSKTCLVSEAGLSAEDTAFLGDAFLTDTVALATHPVVGAEVRLAQDGDPNDLPVAARSLQVFSPSGNDLGERLVRIFESAFEEQPDRPVCVIGDDVPHLPPAFLREAFGRLASPGVDAVLGPSEDGGYYLVGLKRPQPELFRDIAWSTSAVLEATLARAAAAQIAVSLLPRWYDIDTPQELARLSRDVHRGVATAPATTGALAQLPQRGRDRITTRDDNAPT